MISVYSLTNRADRVGMDGTMRRAALWLPMDDVRFLHHQAEKCRTAAVAAENEHARRGLQQLASHYEREARRLNLAEIEAL